MNTNDLPEAVSSQARLFADDSLLYRKIGSPTDCHLLQRDLDSLQKWEEGWQMSFNASKCEALHVTNEKSPAHHYYTIHGEELKKVDKGQVLGSHHQQEIVLESSYP